MPALLQKRYLADALSGANLVCGLLGMLAAAHDRLEVSLLFLLAGAAFDGLDGAAARLAASCPPGRTRAHLGPVPGGPPPPAAPAAAP